MRHFEHTIHVDAPVQHVWDCYLDASRRQDWMPHLSHLGDFSGPLDTVGTTYVGTVQMAGHEVRATYTVLRVVPQTLYHEQSDIGPVDNRLWFEPEGDGTLVTIEVDYETPGHLSHVIQDLMNQRFLERQTRQMLADFKAMAEATVPVAV
jgi:uncharacterized membrane protein